MSTVYLHIGMPKTATTALQTFLPLNQKILNRQGFVYPDMPFHFDGIGIRRNGHFLTFWMRRKQHPEWKKGFEVVEKATRRYENIILSDENLWSRQRLKKFWKRVKKKIYRMNADIKVIVYLRRQDDQVESHWNQKVKSYKVHITKSFEDYMRDGGYDYMPFDYDKALDRIADRIGKENLIVRPFEKQQFVGGTIFSDFINALGLEYTDEYELPPYTANVRLPDNAVEIKRQVNHLFEGNDLYDFYSEAIVGAFGTGLLKERPRPKTSMFSPEQRAEFMKRYEEGNAYVAREYLGREDGVLFYDDPDALPQWKPDDREMMEDTVRILGGADVYLYEQQEEIRRQIQEIYDTLPFAAYRRLAGKKKP
ncbi:MAG: hypothetical protein IJ682_05575 [Lachnospiraceae bacterium]|nr:hypothetical protein [Lachnospiraceae bacterium]